MKTVSENNNNSFRTFQVSSWNRFTQEENGIPIARSYIFKSLFPFMGKKKKTVHYGFMKNKITYS